MASLRRNSPVERRPIDNWRWGVVWLMFLATLINYMDRQAIIATAQHIKHDFNLREEDYGWIEFWFGISYGLLQIPAGYLADRFNIRWIYAGALLLWSAAGFCTGLAYTFAGLAACRVMLGVGEAFNWPCAVGVVRRLVPLDSRAFANGIFHSGASFGAVLMPLLVLAIVGPHGERWRLLFMAVGALGLFWAGLWFWLVRGQRAAQIGRPAAQAAQAETDSTDGGLPFGRVLLLRTFWITLAVSISVNLCWHFYRTWLTRFLDVDLQLSRDVLLYALAGFFVAADLGSLGAGYLTRWLTYRGWSVEASRKLVLLGSALLCLLSAPAVLLGDPWLALPLIYLVSIGAMGGFPVFFALSQEVSPRHASFCLGIFGSTAWLMFAVLNPPIGRWADQIGTFVPAFIIAGFIPLAGALIGFFWPEPVKADCRMPIEDCRIKSAI